MARELAIENGKLKSDLDANGNKVANLATPTSDNDAATKKYVDERPVPSPSWSDITGKPDTFPPEAHTHTKSEITDFPETMPPTAHSHASDSWFTTALGGKLDKTHNTDRSAHADIRSLITQTRSSVELAHGNIRDLQSNKLDKTDVVDPHDATEEGKAADALATKTALASKAEVSDFSPTNPAPYVSGVIDARLPYPLYAVPSTGLLKDRAINTTSLASVTVPNDFTDLLIRASVASSLPVTMPDAITTKYGDTFPAAAGEYLITITKTGAAEAYVRVIKLEVAQ